MAPRALDLEALLARLFAPARPRLEQARAAAASISDPAAAWDALRARGLIGDDPRRLFAHECEACGRSNGALYADNHETDDRPALCIACRGSGCGWVGVPRDRDACIALAADADGVVAAEANAREFVARLAAWGVPQPARVAWRREDGEFWRRYHCGANTYGAEIERPHDAAGQALGLQYWRFSDQSDWLENKRGQRTIPLGCDVSGAVAWTRAVELDLRVPDAPEWPPAVRGRRFAELPDPFEPLLALWQTGYAIESATDGAIVLIVPAFDPEVAPRFVEPSDEIAAFEAFVGCARPGIEPLPATLGEAIEPRACWETLAARGAIPPEWLGSGGPVFARPCSARDHAPTGCAACGDRGVLLSAEPPSADVALALASDPSATLTAEAYAREVLARLVPWGAAPTTCVAWAAWDVELLQRTSPVPEAFDHRTGPSEAARISFYSDRALGPVRFELDRARFTIGEGFDEVRGGRVPNPYAALASALSYSFWWRVVIANDLRVCAIDEIPPALVGRRFAELGDPWEPFRALCSMGLLLCRRVDTDVALLVVPPLDGSHGAASAAGRRAAVGAGSSGE